MRIWQRGGRGRPGAVAALVMMIAGVLGSAGPAAAAYVDVDHFALGETGDAGDICYGACGFGASSGTLNWSLHGTGPVQRRVTGYAALGIQGPQASTLCARVLTVYLRKDGKELARRASTSLCLVPPTRSNGNGSLQFSPLVNEWPALYRVRIVLQQGPSASGPWTLVDRTSCVFETSDCP